MFRGSLIELFKMIWRVELDREVFPLLIMFGVLFGIMFGGIVLDVVGYTDSLFSIVCFSTGFLFGQLVSVVLIKMISL